ncbi:HD-GYP domain-containing protein [Proteinivorax hydrogeniformans]|uniref:HD-GYP domain-containing protein n=1 Tax=Proteinivorax hydrogeniformans TaxID=1826727 RepID=A0AAU8HQR7_9FIRM
MSNTKEMVIIIYTGKVIERDIYNHSSDDGKVKIVNKYKDDILEVNIYEFKKDITGFFRAPKKENSVKTYYILEGELYNYDTGRFYSKGDMIILDYNSEPFNIYPKTDVKILVNATYDNSYEKSNQYFKELNETLEKIHAKDDYTSHHSHRVYEFVRMLALELGYKGQKLRNILHAAKYHDVGKIFIDDAILNKPSSLTEKEFEVMKTHVVKGEDFIVSCFGKPVFDIACQHHERIDGSGYPYGLTDKEISEEGKIIAICDSYDAMTTDRVYKKGKSKQEAIDELKELKGTKYDPELVDLFVHKVLTKPLKKTGKMGQNS